MTQKKPLNTVAIGVGVLCFVLLIGIMAIYLTYNSMLRDKDAQIESLNTQIASLGGQPNPNTSTEVSDLQAQIASLQGQVNDLQSQLSQKNADIDSLNSQIANLNSQIDNLNSQIADLNSIINLQKSTIWVDSKTVSQTASSYTYWTGTANNAGYVNVYVESSTTSNTYVEVKYSSYGVSYDNKITVGTSGSALFPVLPASIEVRVGNSNLLNGATETVTITYIY